MDTPNTKSVNREEIIDSVVDKITPRVERVVDLIDLASDKTITGIYELMRRWREKRNSSENP